MNGDQQEKVPKVFISYSHDNPPHKAWVAEHATKLRENGIDVRFDRWDLRRGEDVAKFMEQAVTWADRVLMICTDAYVRKADEGKGGVGYEAMIVTGELIKDLGTAKFIPIIRQDGGKADVPKFMGTRFYVNLSEGQKLDEEFQELLRELHNEPALKKPAIAVRLVMTRIQRPYESESHRLFENGELIGWPKSLQSCTVGWSFLVDLSEKVSWVAKIFGDVDSYKSALHAYYLTLNVFELATVLAAGREEDLNKNEYWIGIPVISAGISEEQKRKAYRLLTRNPKAMVGIWEARGVSTAKMKEAWPKWLQHTQNTRGRLGYWISSHSGLPHKNLFDDLAA